jgi:endonuclease YncB( thermonuclease family)
MWQRVAAIMFAAFLLLVVIAGISGGKSTKDQTRSLVAASTTATTTAARSTTLATTTTPPTPSLQVASVVDGRTVLGSNGKRVQVVGLAAPGECWAQSATDFATKTLSGKEIRVVAAAGELATVLLPDGTDFAVSALRQGMAKAEATAGSALTTAQAVAQQAGAGLWGGTCKGADTIAPPPPPPPAPTVQQPVAPQPTAKPDPPSSVSYKNCAAVKAAGAAPLYAGQPGYGSHLDRDGDGVACEK